MGLIENFIIESHLKNFFRNFYHLYEDLIEAGAVKKNKILRNIYAGQRCFIIGTGASLCKLDLTMLKKEYTFGCSYLFKHKDIQSINIKLYADIAPSRAWKYKRDAIIFFSNIDKQCVNPDVLIFVRAEDKRFFERHNIFNGRKVFYVKPSLPMGLAKIQSNELTQRITFLDGTIFFMIAAAIYMGFKELYLCGCGYTYQPLQVGHFYDDWTKLDYTLVNDRHNIMKKFADDFNVRIFNIVPDGFESPIYEKVSWPYLVENVLPNHYGDIQINDHY